MRLKINVNTLVVRGRDSILAETSLTAPVFLTLSSLVTQKEQTEAEGAGEGLMPGHMSHKTILRRRLQEEKSRFNSVRGGERK